MSADPIMNNREPRRFERSFTQQEPVPESAIERVVEILRSGRLHRYNTAPGEISEAALLEQEYAAYQGSTYCLACASGGYSLHVAMRAAGLKPGEPVLANAWTLAPVPGAIHNAGGVPVFVEIGDDLRIDTDDLAAKARTSGARFLMLSHMRGHIGDMARITEICDAHGIVLIEDCAHTMGAKWDGTRSGNFGRIACFSAQTYKHINAGEGGLLTTNDPDIAARATVLSGSYMLYERHGAGPAPGHFDGIKLETPNYSGRMDNVRAAILRAQLPALDHNVEQWNKRYRALEAGLRNSVGIKLIERPAPEQYVGSSIQFHVQTEHPSRIPAFVAACAARGVELKWFGAEQPNAFTSRYDSWRYLGEPQPLPQTIAALTSLCDMRVPLTFSEDDCRLIAQIVCEVAMAHFG